MFTDFYYHRHLSDNIYYYHARQSYKHFKKKKKRENSEFTQPPLEVVH